MPLRSRTNAFRRQLAMGLTLVLGLAVAQRSVFASPEESAPASVEALSRELARAAARSFATSA